MKTLARFHKISPEFHPWIKGSTISIVTSLTFLTTQQPPSHKSTTVGDDDDDVRPCKDEYGAIDAGTCRECYEDASENEEELKLEIEELKAKVNFLRFRSPTDLTIITDLLLLASPTFFWLLLMKIPANRSLIQFLFRRIRPFCFQISVAYLISIMPLPPLFACEKRLFCTLFINTQFPQLEINQILLGFHCWMGKFLI